MAYVSSLVLFAASASVSAQIGPNAWWPVRGGLYMYWTPPSSEPLVSLVQQHPVGFIEGVAAFSSDYTVTKLVGDATGVRYLGGQFVNGSRQRKTSFLDSPSSTAQQIILPDAEDRNIVYFATAPELTGRVDWGGYQGYHIARIDLRAGFVTEPFWGLLPDMDSLGRIGLHSTEIIAAAAFPSLNRVWIVHLFSKPNDMRRFDDDSTYLFAYRISNGILSPPIVSKIMGSTPTISKFTFNESGSLAYIANTVFQFSAETGAFTVYKRLDTPIGTSLNPGFNTITNGLFSPSGRYLWIPRQMWADTFYINELLQYDLESPQDTIRPIYRNTLTIEPWFSPYDWNYVHCAMGPDCRLYFSFRSHIGRIEYPDLMGDAAAFNPTWRAVPSTFRGVPGFTGLPDLVNQLTFPDGQKSCLWPRVEVPSDTICEGGCVELTSVYYNNVDTWEWTFDGGVPSTFTGKVLPCVRYDSAGTYAVRLIATNNAGRDTISSHVLVRTRPSVSAGPDVQMCRGGSAVLTASGAVAYRWQPREGLSDTSSASPTARPLRDTMTYVVTGTDAFGCTNVDTIVVRQGTLVAGITRDTAVCVGASVLLQATGGDGFVWWPSTGLNTTSAATVIASPTTRTTYFVEVRSGTCIDTAMVTVEVFPMPTVVLSGDSIICAGDVSQLTATASEPGEIIWLDEQGSTIGTTVTIDVTPIRRTTYTVIFTSERGCSDTQRITVDVERATTHADVDTVVCAGTDVVIDGVPYTIQRDTSWQVIASTPSGCADTSRITVRTEIVELVTQDAAVCAGEQATCRAFSTGTVQWYDAVSGTLVHNGLTYTTVADVNRSFIVRATSPLGCEAVDTATITVVPPEQWTVVIGQSNGLPGSIVHVPVTSSVSQLPFMLHFAPTAPEAIIRSVTPGRILNDGRDGNDVVVELDAQNADLTWQLYLGARDTIPLPARIDITDSTCTTANVVAGSLTVEGCAIAMRAINMQGVVRMQIFSLLGDLVSDVHESEGSVAIDALPAGLWMVRVYTATSHRDTLFVRP